MKRTHKLLIVLAIGAGLTAGAVAQGQKDWQAPDIAKLPDDKYGQTVRQGKALMEETYKHIGPEVTDVNKRYAGNNLACTSCHMDAGGRKFGNPWVGTFVSFPQYRGREDAISTTEERINGCLERSMNGRKLPLDSVEMKTMTTYLQFLFDRHSRRRETRRQRHAEAASAPFVMNAMRPRNLLLRNLK